MKKVEGKKGFTMVEIVVVLVILAIMAAMGIPSMLGFLEEARGKVYIAEAHTAQLAAQSVYTQLDASGSDTANWYNNKVFTNVADKPQALTQFEKMLQPDIVPPGNTYGGTATTTNGAAGTNMPYIEYEFDNNDIFKKLIYKKNGYTVTIEPGKTATAVKS